MRQNTVLEMDFQQDIVAAFEKHHGTVGFEQMVDVLMGWLIHTMQERDAITKRNFLKAVEKTWDDIAKMGRA